MTQDQRQTYAAAVWDAAQARMGVGRIISPAEYELLHTWMEWGLPLSLVLRAIEETQGNGARSLRYFGPAVLKAMDQWRRAMA